ncbi:hypothetical protein BCR37DRAFT_383507 [Protomyces lactucae-debilis]|uniref:Uncharacterized protein n=1 Tax=Protomyces lactucae-debilis TaxID=2754530 RepID=A0A1Y2EXM7_PROLT|nr:uncharacterized protein BCR37DRAFT_383507 [Protomyces lactucae-debilis]ORY76371.1 hypothetical protein BCR37DRAFT_383507 [Protomyces lactucae-debilis]
MARRISLPEAASVGITLTSPHGPRYSVTLAGVELLLVLAQTHHARKRQCDNSFFNTAPASIVDEGDNDNDNDNDARLVSVA